MTSRILSWYQKNKRDLPWRQVKDPYKIWVSEIILQQTQIKKGIPYYNRFIHRFPNIKSLASANSKDILNVWEGLGYYNRALNMLSAAKTIIKDYRGVFPVEYNRLIALKGVGPYTAAAISSICNNEKKAVVDGNVYRLISRLYNIHDPINRVIGKKKVEHFANQLIPDTNTGTYNQAIMDFGSIQCKKHNPNCQKCPLKIDCKSLKLNLVHKRPVVSSIKKVRNRFFNYLFIENKNHFIIQKRSTHDIWKKLYELPLLETTKLTTTNQVLNHSFLQGFNIVKLKHHETLQHLLSHQKINIHFWRIQVDELILSKKQIIMSFRDYKNYPFPKPIKNYLDKQHVCS